MAKYLNKMSNCGLNISAMKPKKKNPLGNFVIYRMFQASNPLLFVQHIGKVLKLICESAKIRLFLALMGLSMLFEDDYKFFKVLNQKCATERFLICP